ncbi:MAG: two-component system response regulator [Planctomycetota bacterium]|nr:MAG: two-component system response regulator [Planctomycetota bacterium]
MDENKIIHFLIVDDDEVDREFIRRSFKKENITNPLIEAENGLEAINFLKTKDGEYLEKNPIIVLLDLNMPIMGGIEFLSKLREEPKNKKVIVLVMTTSDDIRDKQKAYDYNIAGYIVKGKVIDDVPESISIIKAYMKLINE